MEKTNHNPSNIKNPLYNAVNVDINPTTCYNKLKKKSLTEARVFGKINKPPKNMTNCLIFVEMFDIIALCETIISCKSPNQSGIIMKICDYCYKYVYKYGASDEKFKIERHLGERCLNVVWDKPIARVDEGVVPGTI